MGQSAEELRREIEHSRGQLTSTVDAIGDRVSPGRVVERRVNRAKGGLQSVRERVMGPSTAAAGTVSGTVSGTASGVSDLASSVSDAAGSAAGSAADALATAGDQLRSAPQAVKQVTAERTQGAPLIAGLLAFGAGALVASLVKGSETEGRVAQAALGAAQPIKDAAAEAGQELASSLKDQGQQAVQQVKETATQAAGEVKETAQQSAQQTAETGRDAAQQVAEQGRQATAEVKDQASSSADAVRDRT
jgi:hypothetical protein